MSDRQDLGKSLYKKHLCSKDLKDLKDGVRLCWELEEPKGPKGALQSFLRKGESLGYVGRIKT